MQDDIDDDEIDQYHKDAPTKAQRAILAAWDALPWQERQKQEGSLSGAEQIAAGLAIFIRIGSTECAAEHDVFYSGCSGPLTDDDARELARLGWHYDDECDSWAIFT